MSGMAKAPIELFVGWRRERDEDECTYQVRDICHGFGVVNQPYNVFTVVFDQARPRGFFSIFRHALQERNISQYAGPSETAHGGAYRPTVDSIGLHSPCLNSRFDFGLRLLRNHIGSEGRLPCTTEWDTPSRPYLPG